MTRFLIFLTALFFYLFPVVAQADFYQYTDQAGTVVMVDDESKIPARYRKKTRTTKSDPAHGSKITAVRIRNNQVLVPVRFSYRNTSVDAWLLLDTGASTTLISSALAARLGIKAASTQRRLSQVADGRVVETFRTRLDFMAVGPKVKHDAEVAIMPSSGRDMGFDGLLGMNFLRDFPHHLDINSQTIEWRH